MIYEFGDSDDRMTREFMDWFTINWIEIMIVAESTKNNITYNEAFRKVFEKIYKERGKLC